MCFLCDRNRSIHTFQAGSEYLGESEGPNVSSHQGVLGLFVFNDHSNLPQCGTEN